MILCRQSIAGVFRLSRAHTLQSQGRLQVQGPRARPSLVDFREQYFGFPTAPAPAPAPVPVSLVVPCHHAPFEVQPSLPLFSFA